MSFDALLSEFFESTLLEGSTLEGEHTLQVFAERVSEAKDILKEKVSLAMLLTEFGESGGEARGVQVKAEWASLYARLAEAYDGAEGEESFEEDTRKMHLAIERMRQPPTVRDDVDFLVKYAARSGKLLEAKEEIAAALEKMARCQQAVG